MKKSYIGKKDKILLSFIFFPLFPLKFYFLSSLICEIFNFSKSFSFFFITLSILTGFLFVFYFYRCMSANAFYMNKKSSFSLYLIYFLMFFIFFRDIVFYNLILAFFASYFVSSKAFHSGKKLQIFEIVSVLLFLSFSALSFSFLLPKFVLIPEIRYFSINRISDFFAIDLRPLSENMICAAFVFLSVPFALLAGFYISGSKRGIDR